MSKHNAIVAVFDRHSAAESAIRKLADSNFDSTKLRIVGKGYRRDEKVIGFYNAGDRTKSWGQYGAFWGSLRGLYVGGVFMTVLLVETVMVFGHLGALRAPLFSIGIQKVGVAGCA